MTTYYVRTIADDFNFDLTTGAQTGGYSLTSHFEIYNEAALGATYAPWGHKTNRLFSTTTQTLYAFANVSGIHTLTTRTEPPPKSTISSSNVIVQADSSGTFYWCDRQGNGSFLQGWGMERWVGQGWTSPFTNYSTWISELCTAFDTINIGSVVTRNNNINLVIFKYKFTNYPENGRHFLFPVFYVGNDPRFDSTVVI